LADFARAYQKGYNGNDMSDDQNSQAAYQVGYKRPPKQYQFKPGQSGNPVGPPVRRTNLWVWFCNYMAKTDSQLARLKAQSKKKLTQAQQTALKLVEVIKTGRRLSTEHLVLSVFDREEGRADSISNTIINQISQSNAARRNEESPEDIAKRKRFVAEFRRLAEGDDYTDRQHPGREAEGL